MAEPIFVSIPTTETLPLERLCALADAALAPTYDVIEDMTIGGGLVGGAIHFEVIDEKAASFWRARGDLWGDPEYPNFIPIADALDAARQSTEESDV